MRAVMGDLDHVLVSASVVARWLDIAARIDDRDQRLLHPLRAFNRQGRRLLLEDALDAAEQSAAEAEGRLEQHMAIVLAAELRVALGRDTRRLERS